MIGRSVSRRALPGRSALPWSDDAGGFRCVNCRRQVPATWLVSGVQNRNHCPYCLHSRHLDLLQPGDRLSACKGSMRPIGLTFKRIRNKYGDGAGELMLVHRCVECGKLSVNRVAADDNDDAMLTLLEQSAPVELDAPGIHLLTSADLARVRAQLFGKN